MQGNRLIHILVTGILTAACPIPSPSAEVYPDSLVRLLENASLVSGQSWLDQLSLSGDGSTFSPNTPTTSLTTGRPFFIQLQGRYRNIETGNTPSLWNRLDVRSEEWGIGGLTARDANERSFTDLYRIYLEHATDNQTLVLGSFQANQGLGWTIRSSPSLPASYASLSPSQNRTAGISANRSGEEGRGWQGGGFDYHYRSLNTSFWAGRSFYDAREGSDGPLPYSTQGDHTGSRTDNSLNLGESHTGAHIAWETLADNNNTGTLFQLGATGWISRWDTPLASDGLASRFRYGDSRRTIRSFGVDGRLWQNKIWAFSGEITHLDNDAWGGAGILQRSFLNLSLIAMVYRATITFQPLHARPFLPFGDDPAGRSGLYTGLETSFHRWLVGGWWAGEHREPIGGNDSQHRNGIRLYASGPINERWHLDVRGSLGNVYEQDTSDRRRSFRAHTYHEMDAIRKGLRYEHTWEDNGDGELLAGYFQTDINPAVHGAVQIGWVRQFDNGATVTLIEPFIPGLFPFRQVGTEGLYGSATITFRVFRTVEGWTRAQFARTLETPSETTRNGSLGIQIRFNSVGKRERN